MMGCEIRHTCLYCKQSMDNRRNLTLPESEPKLLCKKCVYVKIKEIWPRLEEKISLEVARMNIENKEVEDEITLLDMDKYLTSGMRKTIIINFLEKGSKGEIFRFEKIVDTLPYSVTNIYVHANCDDLPYETAALFMDRPIRVYKRNGVYLNTYQSIKEVIERRECLLSTIISSADEKRPIGRFTFRYLKDTDGTGNLFKPSNHKDKKPELKRRELMKKKKR